MANVAFAAETVSLISGTNVNNAQENIGPTQEELDRIDSWGPCGCFAWFTTASTPCMARCEFIGWIICFILSIIFYATFQSMDDQGAVLNYGYFLTAGLSIAMSMYSTTNFGTILEIQRTVNSLIQSVIKLTEGKDRLKNEVGDLFKVKDKLAAIEEEQSIANAQMRSQIKQFETWNQQIIDKSGKNVNELIDLKDEIDQKIEGKRREINQKERNILYNALDAFEKRGDGMSGLNKFEFENFINALPMRYIKKFRASKVLFDHIADGDDIIDDREFKQYLDGFLIEDIAELAKELGIEMPNRNDGVPQRQQQRSMELHEEQKEK